MKSYFVEYKEKYLVRYIEEYKKGNKTDRRLLKENIYNDLELTEKEKDNIWSTIVRFCNK